VREDKSKIVNLKDKRLAKELDDIDLEVQKINDLLNALLANVTLMLEQYGLEERDENFSKNFYYVAEALRSLVLSHFKINHPFQEIVEKSVAVEWDAERNTWNLRWDELFLKKLDLLDKQE